MSESVSVHGGPGTHRVGEVVGATLESCCNKCSEVRVRVRVSVRVKVRARRASK